MGILDSLKKAVTAVSNTPPASPPNTAAPSPNSAAAAKAAALVGSKAAPAPKELSRAEVEAIIEARVKEKGKPSNWKVSIVDLLTALDMKSSLDARKVLAARLNYSGSDADGSAEKNNWLHAELLKVLAKNEGKVPSNLL